MPLASATATAWACAVAPPFSFLASLREGHPLVRSLLAGATAWLFCLVFGRTVIARLKHLNIREKTEKTPIEDEQLRQRIQAKSGTPTMGGILLLGGLLAGCLLWADLGGGYVGLALLSVFVLAVVGALDDRLKLGGKGHTDRGLKIRHKLLIQAPVGAALGLLVFRQLGAVALTGPPASLLPFVRGAGLTAALVFAAWGAVLVGAMSNATNVTDGLDGLLAGLTPLAAVVLGIACWAAGSPRASAWLGVTYVPGAAELGVFCGALSGACLGFLWFNRHPARVFMGDTGSMAIGGGLAVAAMAARQELLLTLVGLVFLAEFGSSLLQMGFYKIYGRRILPVAPIHHIFEKQGHAEPRIVRGFYLLGAVVALTGLNLMRHASDWLRS